MMSRMVGVATVLLAVANAGASEKTMPVQGSKAAVEPRPVDELKSLAGTWTCDGMSRGAAGTPVAFKARFTNKWDLAQSWLSMRYEQTPAKGQALVAQGLLGWDAADKRFVLLGADSAGGWMNVGAGGWTGESLALVGEGTLDGKKLPLRFTFTRGKSEKDLMFAIERQDGTRWSLVTQDTCKR